MGNATLSALSGKSQAAVRPLRGPVAVIMAATLFLSACATTTRPQTSDEQALRDYSVEYTATGAVTGAAAGALAGCLILILADADCGTGAAVGAGVGAVAGGTYGYSVASQTEQYASAQERLQAQQTAASRELAAARSARVAAERLVAEEVDALEKARLDLASQQVSSQSVQRQLASANELQENLKAADDRLLENVRVMQDQIRDAEQEMGIAPTALIDRRDELLKERQALQAQLSTLTEEIVSTEGALS